MNKNQPASQLHQYYKDQLSSEIELMNYHEISDEIIKEIVNGNNFNISLINELKEIKFNELNANFLMAEKNIITAILLANTTLDRHNFGIQKNPNQAFVSMIIGLINEAFRYEKSFQMLVNSIQILFRIGAASEVIDIIEEIENHELLPDIVHRIAAIIYSLDEKYDESSYHLNFLKSNSLNKPLVSLLKITNDWKITRSSSFLDFSYFNKTKKEKYGIVGTKLSWVKKVKEKELLTPTIFIAADTKYFYEHVIALIKSIYFHNKDKLHLHLHIYNINDAIINSINILQIILPKINISVSEECVNIKQNSLRTIFACRRFLAANNYVNEVSGPLIFMDADALFNRNWFEWKSEKKNRENAKLIFSTKIGRPFWEKITAGVLYFEDTELSKNYLFSVAKFIEINLLLGKGIWFLDQIALSACFDEFLSHSDTLISMESPDDLMTVNLNSEALAWVTTTQKNKSKEYNNKKLLMEDINGNFSKITPGIIFPRLKKIINKISFVQIGAMDGVSYDPIHTHVKEGNWTGLLIEPLPDMFARLKKNYAGTNGLIFENVAISVNFEDKILYRIEPEKIKKFNLPKWTEGMSTFDENKLVKYNPHVTETIVKCYPLQFILDKFEITEIDVVQIDTEGFDYKIFSQINFDLYRPKIINIEIINLSQDEKILLQSELIKHNYVWNEYEMDLIAIDVAIFANIFSDFLQ